MKRKVMAILMAAALCVGLLPSTTLAETGEYTAEDAENSAEETEEQAADIEITEDGTATIVVGDVAGEEQEEEPVETEEPAEPEGEADEAEEVEEEEAEPDEVVYTAKDDSVSVEVTAPYGALPEEAELKVERFATDSQEYRDAAEAIGLDEDATNMAALDISFVADGEEVEPSEAVKVSIDASKILPEDADASTLEVQHLKEGRAGQVKAEVVANESAETEGTIDEAKAIAEFEVKSFSVFTVEWNDGTETSIEVHIYSINGTSVDEELDEDSALIANNGTITIQDLVDHLESNVDYTNEYTYRYAMVVYQVAQQPSGYEMTKIGSEDNSVTSISKSGTTYTIYRGGTTSTISDPDSIVIRLYYSVPEVTISTDNAHEGEVTFTTSSNYFNGEVADATYTWTLSNDSEGTLTNNNDGTATFIWGENAQAGDKETVTVTMTIGDETASDTYTLTYGDQQVSITVYANGTTTGQANAHVALVDAYGNTVATGTTDENGQVTLYAPAGTYTVGVTYCVADTSDIGGGSTSRYTAEGTVAVGESGSLSGDTTITLGTAITSGPNGNTNGSYGGGSEPYYYEHIDVKVAVAETTESSATFSDLDAVYVYDKYGNLIYYSDDLNQNPGTTDYNVLFDINGAEDTHSIVVSSEDTIVIVYEIYEDGEYKTYTATYASDGTYKSDDYYPYNSINAYQLYNNLYGGNYADQEAFEAAWEAGEVTGAGYNEAGIPIGGQSYTLIADYLCDTRTTGGQAGLDFVIDVLDAVFEEYDIQIAKTYNTPTTFNENDLETFNFTLQQIDKVTASDDDQEGVWDTTGDNLLNTTNGSTESWTGGDGVWTSIIDLENILTYEAEDGVNFYYYVLSESNSEVATAETQYVGIKITVTYSASTGQTEIVASYCALEATDEDGVYNKTGTWIEMEMQEGTDGNGDPYYYYEVPFVNNYIYSVDVYKYDSTTNEPLEYVTFILWRISDGEEEAFADFTYNEETGVNTVSAWIPANTALGNYNYLIYTDDKGYIHIAGLEPGDYWLEEQDPLEGYQRAEKPFSFTVNEDGTITSEYWSEDMSAIAIPNDEETINVRKTDSNGNPLEGAEFVMGRIEQNAINISIPIEGTDYHYEYLTFTEDTETGTYVYIPDGEVDTRVEATTLITDEDGYIHLRELNIGTLYFLVETKAPEGYEMLEDPIVFWIDYDGNMTLYLPSDDEHVSASDDTITVVDDVETFDVLIYKYADDGQDDGNDEPSQVVSYRMKANSTETYAVSNNPLEGAEFSLSRETDEGVEYAVAERILNDEYNYYYYTITEWTEEETEATTLLTDTDGYLEITNLEAGTYTLTETKAPEGYYLLEDSIVFTVDSEGALSVVSGPAEIDETTGAPRIAVANTEITGGFELDKTDEEGNALLGAEFILGYFWEHAEQIYNVTPDNQYDYYYGILNYDEEFGTYVFDWNQYAEERDDATTLATDEDGKLGISNLPVSDEFETGFFLIETKAPAGYELLEDPIVFTVSDDGTIEIAVNNDQASVNDDGTVMTVIDNLITVDISGSKTWMNDEESDRPESITVYLFADGDLVTDDEGNAVTATATADDWTWSFTDLPKYQSDGETEIVYTVLEGEITDTDSSYIPTYDYETDEDGNITIIITNAIPEVHKVVSDPAYGESTDDGLHKDEADNNDILEYRMEADHIGGAHNLVLHDFLDDQLDPETLEIKSVTLYTSEEDEDGTVLVEGTGYEVNTGECSAPDCGLEGCSFEIHVFDEDVQNLSADAYVIVIFDIEVKEGVEDFDESYVDEVDNWVGLSFVAYNVWTLADEPEPGYGTPEETETYSYGFDLYKYDADTSEPLAGVEFVMSNSNGKYAQFDATDSTYLLTGWVDSQDDATAIVTGSDGNAVVEGLHDGTFSIEETKAPEGYQQKTGTMTVTISVSDDDPTNPTITATNADVDGGEVQISNTPGEDMIEIIGSKTWDDADDADGVRPDSITIHLLADGTEVASETVTADDNWAWSFADMPKYQDDGETEIVYTITEDAVDDYDTTINNYNVTNTHEYETRDISGSKTWEDDNDKADARPSSITVNLYQDGELYDSKTVTEDDGWAWSWTGLLKNANGEAIAYTITEDEVEYYDTTYYSGSFDITNTFTGEEGAENPGSGTNQGGDNPKTADTNTLGVWLSLLVAAMACMLVGFRLKRRS